MPNDSSEKTGVAVDVDHDEHTPDQQLGHLANAEDHQLTKLEAIKKNPKACAWTLFAIWMVLLVSYENQASGNILGIPQFRKDFGYLAGDEYVLSPGWQSAFTAAPIARYVLSLMTPDFSVGEGMAVFR